jgi:hypothetical protein
MPSLFYSDKCKNCKLILKLLKTSKFLKTVKLYCVDNQKVPKNIKIVPTVITSNQVLVGNTKVLKWVQKLVKSKDHPAIYQPENGHFSSFYTYLSDVPQLDDLNNNYQYLNNSSSGFAVFDKKAINTFNLNIRDKLSRAKK